VSASRSDSTSVNHHRGGAATSRRARPGIRRYVPRAGPALAASFFDFGKTLAATDASRKLAEVAVEDVELQRQLIALAVKEAYTNTLFSQRLIRVQEQAVERAELNLRSAKGFFDVGTRPKSDVARARSTWPTPGST